jgi:hypothetical protein
MAKNRAGFPSNKEDDDDGQVKLELMMENAGVPGHCACGPSPFSADEWVESSAPCDSPGQWSEWKIEDDLAYARFLDNVYERNDERLGI